MGQIVVEERVVVAKRVIKESWLAVEAARGKIVFWSVYVNHQPFLNQVVSHKLKEGHASYFPYMVLVTHSKYFAPIFLDCRGPCDPSEPGEEPLRNDIDRVSSG
jgi:hypothetical protein